MHSWDVVNEAIDLKSGRPDALRRTLWLDALGERYIDRAFHLAHRADPGARLAYNDFGLDHADNESRRKRAAVLALLRALQSREVPIHALGVQAHLTAGAPFEASGLQDFFGAVAALGLDIYITELDVTDTKLPDEGRDVAVAALVASYLEAALREPAVKAVLTWRLSDRYTWLNSAHAGSWRKRADGKPIRGLPLDAELRRKPMWHAIADAFETRRA